jgi:hypothetical protein
MAWTGDLASQRLLPDGLPRIGRAPPSAASRSGGVLGDAQDVHPPGLDLHHEEDVQALEEHGVNAEEVTRQDPRRLGDQELPPGG